VMPFLTGGRRAPRA